MPGSGQLDAEPRQPARRRRSDPTPTTRKSALSVFELTMTKMQAHNTSRLVGREAAPEVAAHHHHVHADTRAFKFLRYVGLKKWVNQMTSPTATGTAE